VQPEAQGTDPLVQLSDAAEELIVGRIDVFGEEALDLGISRPRGEPAKNDIVLDALDHDPAEIAILLILEGDGL